MKFVPLRQLIKSKVKGNEALEFLVDNIKDEFIADSIEEFLIKAVKKEKKTIPEGGEKVQSLASPKIRQEVKADADKILAANPEKVNTKKIVTNQESPTPTNNKIAATKIKETPTATKTPTPYRRGNFSFKDEATADMWDKEMADNAAGEKKTTQKKTPEKTVTAEKTKTSDKETPTEKTKKPKEDFTSFGSFHPDAQKIITDIKNSVFKNHGHSEMKGRAAAIAQALKNEGLDENGKYHKHMHKGLEDDLYSIAHKAHSINEGVTNPGSMSENDHINEQKELAKHIRDFYRKLNIIQAAGGLSQNSKNAFHFDSGLGGGDPEAIVNDAISGGDGALMSYKGNPLSGAHPPITSKEDFEEERARRAEGHSGSHRSPTGHLNQHIDTLFDAAKNAGDEQRGAYARANLKAIAKNHLKDPMASYNTMLGYHNEGPLVRSRHEKDIEGLNEGTAEERTAQYKEQGLSDAEIKKKFKDYPVREKFGHISDFRKKRQETLEDIQANDPIRAAYLDRATNSNLPAAYATTKKKRFDASDKAANKILGSRDPGYQIKYGTSAPSTPTALEDKPLAPGKNLPGLWNTRLTAEPLSTKQKQERKELRGAIAQKLNIEQANKRGREILDKLIPPRKVETKELNNQMTEMAKDTGTDLLGDINISSAHRDVPGIVSKNQDQIIGDLASAFMSIGESRRKSPETLTTVGKKVDEIINKHLEDGYEKNRKQYEGLKAGKVFDKGEYKKHFDDLMRTSISKNLLPGILKAMFAKTGTSIEPGSLDIDSPEEVATTIGQIKDKNIRQMFDSALSSITGETNLPKELGETEGKVQTQMGIETPAAAAARQAGLTPSNAPLSNSEASDAYNKHIVGKSDENLANMKKVFAKDPEFLKTLPEGISANWKAPEYKETEEDTTPSVMDRLKSIFSGKGDKKRYKNLADTDMALRDTIENAATGAGENIKIFKGKSGEKTVGFNDLPENLRHKLVRDMTNNFGKPGKYKTAIDKLIVNKNDTPEVEESKASQRNKLIQKYVRNSLVKTLERHHNNITSGFGDSGIARWSSILGDKGLDVNGKLEAIQKEKNPENKQKQMDELKQSIIEANRVKEAGKGTKGDLEAKVKAYRANETPEQKAARETRVAELEKELKGLKGEE